MTTLLTPDYDDHRIEVERHQLSGIAVGAGDAAQRAATSRGASSPAATTRRRCDDISLDIKQGEFICVVGPSGCGKSTLLNLVAGLDQADGGRRSCSTASRSRGAGADRVVVFQEAALYPWLNVRANVEFGLKMKGVPQGASASDIVDSTSSW